MSCTRRKNKPEPTVCVISIGHSIGEIAEFHLPSTKTIANPSRIGCAFLSQACAAISNHYSLCITTGQRLRTPLQHSEKHNGADGPLVFLPDLSNKSSAISCMSSDLKHSQLQTKVAMRSSVIGQGGWKCKSYGKREKG